MKKRIVNLLICLTAVLALLPLSEARAASGDELVSEARKHIGKPYSSSSRIGPDSFDCSGLVWYVCNSVGISMSIGNAESQKSYGTAVDYTALKSYDDCSLLKAGDLIFFDYDSDGKTDHVAIYSDSGNVIHALSKGVAETPLSWTTGVLSGQRFYQAVTAVKRVAETDEAVSVSTSVEDDGNSYKLFASISNLTQSAQYMAASYDSSGRMLEIKAVRVDSGATECSASLSKRDETAYIKTFLWNGMKNMTALTGSEKIENIP